MKELSKVREEAWRFATERHKDKNMGAFGTYAGYGEIESMECMMDSVRKRMRRVLKALRHERFDVAKIEWDRMDSSLEVLRGCSLDVNLMNGMTVYTHGHHMLSADEGFHMKHFYDAHRDELLTEDDKQLREWYPEEFKRIDKELKDEDDEQKRIWKQRDAERKKEEEARKEYEKWRKKQEQK